MKKITTLLFLAITTTLVTGPVWANNYNEMINACKDAIPGAISITTIKRIKFKSVSGAGRIRTVVLQVQGDNLEKSVVICKINAHTKDVRSLTEKMH